MQRFKHPKSWESPQDANTQQPHPSEPDGHLEPRASPLPRWGSRLGRPEPSAKTHLWMNRGGRASPILPRTLLAAETRLQPAGSWAPGRASASHSRFRSAARSTLAKPFANEPLRPTLTERNGDRDIFRVGTWSPALKKWSHLCLTSDHLDTLTAGHGQSSQNIFLVHLLAINMTIIHPHKPPPPCRAGKHQSSCPVLSLSALEEHAATSP